MTVDACAQVLAMLFDVEMNSISSRQLGQHSAHRMWSAIMQELSAMPNVEVTLAQVRDANRFVQGESSCAG